MTQESFKAQIGRLEGRFGARAFDTEFGFLIWREVKEMSEVGFARAVDVWIGSRTHNKPPLLSEFREAYLSEKKWQLQRDTLSAERMFDGKWNKGLQAYLDKMFPGGKTLAMAVQVRRLEIEMERASNPDYAPECDRKWMGEHAFPKKPNSNGPGAA